MAPGAGSYFGSQEYNKGQQFLHDDYDAWGLTIRHKKTDIKMWSLAFDVREDCEPGQDLRDGDFVLFHYTNKKHFDLITKLSGAELRASFRVEDNKDSYFGHGIYATQKAPDQWPSKDHLLVNNFWPAKKIFQEEYPDEPFPDDGDIESLVKNKNGAAFQRIQNLFGEQWEYCIPLIVDQQVAKNVMTETTDAPLMPKDEDGKRRKRLAGYNRFGEKQPAWRDVWIISVYDAQELSLPQELVAYQPKPKHATQSVEAIAEILHRRLSDFGTQLELEVWHRGSEFQDLLISLLEKIHEKEEKKEKKKKIHEKGEKEKEEKEKEEKEKKYFWLYLKLAKTLEQGTVQIKDKSWDAKGLRERAVQLDPLRAYKRMLKDAVDLRLDGRAQMFDIGQETLDERQLLMRTIKACPDYVSLYWHLAQNLDPQKVAQLFDQLGDPDWARRWNLEEGIHGETGQINNEIACYFCEQLVLGERPTESPALPNRLGTVSSDVSRRGTNRGRNAAFVRISNCIWP
eukprot:Skav226778  [mRNA]  locus=scaffold8:285692:287414:- [translate_table: standard]